MQCAVGRGWGFDMRISDAGLALIKRFEGLRLDAYKDVAGIWTIGYGHIKTAKPGMKITESQAETLLKDDLQDAERGVERLVKVPISSNEFSALVSLVFNIGEGAFAKSTTLRRLNANDRVTAADAIELWNKATVGGKKTVVQGLVRRRAAEKALFLEPGADSKMADTGLESGIVPTEENAGRRGNLAGSRTVQGSVATGATGAATVATGVGNVLTKSKDNGTEQQPSAPAESGAQPSTTPQTPSTETATQPTASTPTPAPPATNSETAPATKAQPAQAPDKPTAQTIEIPPQAQRALDFVQAHPNEMLMLAGGIILLASLYVLYARVDDWVKGKR